MQKKDIIMRNTAEKDDYQLTAVRKKSLTVPGSRDEARGKVQGPKFQEVSRESPTDIQ